MSTIKAVAYARYSSDKQQESSITVQLAAIHKFCASYNIELIHEYIDEAQTGTNANRKDFQEMVKAAPNKDFNVIIVHRMDRWARNVDDARYYKKFFAKYGIKIVSAIEEFDESPEGEFFELMSMGMAELYSKKLSREAKAGKLANAKNGKIHGGVPLLGYKVKGKYYVIEEKEAEAVKIIFDMVSQGYGYTTIRSYLNSNGYRHSDGRLFTGHFTDILRNRKYIGEYVYNRSPYRARGVEYNNHSKRCEEEIIRIPGGMPRIVDDETFYKVQRILDARKNHQNLRGIKSKKYLLTGLLVCSECGKSFCGTKTKTHDIEYCVYKCINRGMACPSKNMNALYLEEYLIRILSECLLNPQNTEKLCTIIKACYIKAYDSTSAKADEIKAEINKINTTIEEQRNLYINNENKVLKSFVDSGIKELERELIQSKNKLQDLENRLLNFPSFQPLAIKKKAKHLCNTLKGDDFKTTQKSLNLILKCVNIGNDTVEITIDTQALIGDYIDKNITIIERRDNIARRENHSKQALAFPTLEIKIK